MEEIVAIAKSIVALPFTSQYGLRLGNHIKQTIKGLCTFVTRVKTEYDRTLGKMKIYRNLLRNPLHWLKKEPLWCII